MKNIKTEDELEHLMIVLPHAGDGGMPRVAATLAQHLAEFYSITVVLLINNMAVNFKFRSRIIGLCRKGEGTFSKSYRFFERIFRLNQLIRQSRPKYILSLGATANIVSILAARNVPVILTEHNIKSLENKSLGVFGPLCTALMRITYRYARKIIALTDAMRLDLVSNFNIPADLISVIQNPHELEEIKLKSSNEIPRIHDHIYKKRVIIAVGNTSAVKAHQHIIRIMPALLTSNSDINLVVLGSAAEQQPLLDKLVLDLGLSSSVYFLGFQENPFPFIAQAKLLVHCSLREGLPNALIEAMSLGIPIISSDCISGPREILAPELVGLRSAEMVYPTFGEYGVLTPNFSRAAPCEPSPLCEAERLFLIAVEKIMTNDELRKEYKRRSVLGSRRYDAATISKQYLRELETCRRAEI